MIDLVLRALVEPHRREILDLIYSQELTVGAIAEHFEVSRPAISQHLKVLEEAGLVSTRAHGTRRYYRLRPQGFNDLRDYLAHYWDVHLDVLKREAEAEERRRINEENRE